jgi:hypothetical protein
MSFRPVSNVFAALKAITLANVEMFETGRRRAAGLKYLLGKWPPCRLYKISHAL